jgi:hypothetical protein
MGVQGPWFGKLSWANRDGKSERDALRQELAAIEDKFLGLQDSQNEVVEDALDSRFNEKQRELATGPGPQDRWIELREGLGVAHDLFVRHPQLFGDRWRCLRNFPGSVDAAAGGALSGFCRSPPTGDLLDVGCGTGSLACAMAARFPGRKTGSIARRFTSWSGLRHGRLGTRSAEEYPR